MVVLISVPLIQFLTKTNSFSPNMLKRIGIGLTFLILQDIINTVLLALPVLEMDVEKQTLNSPTDQYINCYMIQQKLQAVMVQFCG